MEWARDHYGRASKLAAQGGHTCKYLIENARYNFDCPDSNGKPKLSSDDGGGSFLSSLVGNTG